MQSATAAPCSAQILNYSDQSCRQDIGVNPDPAEEPLGGERDLEKAVSGNGTRNGTTSGKIHCVEGVTKENPSAGTFFHPLSHLKTTAENLVGFDGEDDPYRPINWPFRKKFITTLLYGLTTMGSTWASSV